MSKTNYVKLGAFAIAGGLAVVAALTTVGYRSLTKPHDDYTMYFSESVQGLSLGSAVKFRGVVVGHVSGVSVAEDGRHVEVSTELFDDAVARIHLGYEQNESTRLCAQLTPVGLTGTKIVQLDVFDTDDCVHPEELPFAIGDKSIPATRSTLEDVEVAVRKLAKATPEMAQDLSTLVRRINRLVGDVDAQDDPATVATTMAQLEQTLSTIDEVLGGIDTPRMSREVGATLHQLRRTTKNVNELMARLDRQRGLVSRMERASSAVGDLALGFDHSSGDVETTLQDVSEAARAIRRLADTLERDPDMLLKGHAELGP